MKRSTDLVPSFGGVGDVVTSCDDVDVPWEEGRETNEGVSELIPRREEERLEEKDSPPQIT